MNLQQSFTYDICENRHGGDLNSVAANPSDGVKNVWQMWIRNWVMKRRDGGTQQEAAKHFDKDKNAISGRFSELVKAGKLVKLGRRDGFAVYFAVIEVAK